jgi:hypothetical protein
MVLEIIGAIWVIAIAGLIFWGVLAVIGEVLGLD